MADISISDSTITEIIVFFIFRFRLIISDLGTYPVLTITVPISHKNKKIPLKACQNIGE